MEDPFIASEYGILQVFTGHSDDVRSVGSYPEGGALTASRDKTAKLIKPAHKDDPHCELDEVQQFVGPTGVVAAICCGKTKSESKPIATLARHSAEVCTVAFRVCNDQDLLVSGSWDNTATIWTNREPTVTLYGHVNAVWDVAFVARSFILTAGADKTIRKWNIPDGQLLNIFEKHTDCVRGLSVLNAQQFLSCSNDATIIMWSINGDVLNTFEGHENFIYSLCIVRQPLTPGVDPPKNRPYKIVSVSEDQTIKIWDKNAKCLQTIPIQATTLWSVAALDNGNFVVGCSGGFTYVFAPVKAGNSSGQ